MYVHTGKVRKRRQAFGVALLIVAVAAGTAGTVVNGLTILALLLAAIALLIILEANRVR